MAYTDDIPSADQKYQTLQQRLQEKFLFRKFVPPNTLGVVFSGTYFSRFLIPGIANRRPRVGRESLLGYLSLDTVFMPFDYAGILSKDGYLFKVEGTLAYSYDPRISTNITPYLEYLIKALRSRHALDKPIKNLLNQHLHIAIGNLTAIELMSGIRSVQIQQKIARTLGRDLADLGVKLTHTGLVIERLVPPIQLRNAHQKGLSHLLEVMSGLNTLTEDQRNQLIQIKISEHGNLSFFIGNDTFSGQPAIMLPNMWMNQSASSKPSNGIMQS